jgi:hypothetical protein
VPLFAPLDCRKDLVAIRDRRRGDAGANGDGRRRVELASTVEQQRPNTDLHR